ncbi:MAG: PAS domain S-box protein [Pseudomonadota bacterium]|nr:PAS domain S-box protein [Pseudomonadota bacterium]
MAMDARKMKRDNEAMGESAAATEAEAHRQSEAKYRAIFENSREGIFQIQTNGAFLSVNPAFAHLYGYDLPEDLIANVRRLRHEIFANPEDRKRIRTLLAQQGGLLREECEFVDRRGRKIWVVINAHSILDAWGNILYYEGTVEDITARKRMEEQLVETKEKLVEALRIADMGTWEYDLATGAMWYSDELCRMVGCDPRRNPFDLETFLGRIPGDDREFVAMAVQASVGENKPYDVTHRVLFPDGQEKIFHSRGKVYYDNAGAPLRIAGVTQDVTKEKTLERQVIHQEKLASLGMLVSGIAHEINNPNNLIIFNIPILKDYISELIRIADAYAEAHPDYELFGMSYREFREDIFSLLDNIGHGAGRIDGAIRKLQEFSRKGGQDKQNTAQVDDIVRKIASMCRSQLGRTVKTFEVEITPGLPAVFTDADALEHVLVNILLNAGQAMDKEESRLVLRLRQGASWKNRIILEIEDNGRGMGAATRDRVFHPFFTTKPRGEGTGLGLYIAKNLIEGLGGVIEVESAPGKGSLFRIVIPELQESAGKRV